MSITDPRVITFVNEQLRPLAERTRAVQAEIETTLAYAAAREDLLLAMGLLDQLVAEVRLPENADALGAMFKACVRPLRINSGV